MSDRFRNLLLSGGLLAFAITASGDGMSDCPMMSSHADTSAHEHSRGVQSRGDQGMGFSHEKTTHHFRLSAEGGSIEVTANLASDTGTRDQIRMHLGHIAKAFTSGDFAIPMFVHDTLPPGVSTMKRRRGAIRYEYEEIDNGARVRLLTADADALDAIHDFLRFQISEHETGDRMTAPGGE
jgi:hypothetical protein